MDPVLTPAPVCIALLYSYDSFAAMYDLPSYPYGGTPPPCMNPTARSAVAPIKVLAARFVPDEVSKLARPPLPNLRPTLPGPAAA